MRPCQFYPLPLLPLSPSPSPLPLPIQLQYLAPVNSFTLTNNAQEDTLLAIIRPHSQQLHMRGPRTSAGEIYCFIVDLYDHQVHSSAAKYGCFILFMCWSSTYIAFKRQQQSIENYACCLQQILGLLEAFILINISMWTESKGFFWAFLTTDTMLGSVNICTFYIFTSCNNFEGGFALAWSNVG